MSTTETDTIEQINELISKFDFPVFVLNDVNHRLGCCNEEAYVKQQLRYLQNLVKFGKVDLKEEK